MLQCFCHVLQPLAACKLRWHTLFICSAARVTAAIVYDMSVPEKSAAEGLTSIRHFFNISIGAQRERKGNYNF